MPDGDPDLFGRLENIQAEQALLGSLITAPGLLPSLPPTFDPSHYSDELHTEIHRALIEVGQPGVCAAIALRQAMAINDTERAGYIAGLLTAAIGFKPGIVNPYAVLVTDMWRRRQLVTLAGDIRARAYANAADGSTVDGSIAQAMMSLEEMTGQRSDARKHTMLADAMDAALELADRAARGEGATGVPTGFPSIDEALGGLGPGTVTVIAGRPGMGKSALGHLMAIEAAKSGVGVLEISLEMSAIELGRRALCAYSGVPLSALKHGRHGSSVSKLLAARAGLQALPLSIEDGGGLTAGMIALKARAAKRRHGLGLIMVDHIHIVRPDDADVKQGATWAVGRISGAMKRLAKEHDCAVVLLAQLNRGVEGRDDKRPGLGDLRQAGDIEQDADAVGFVYRPEYYLGGQPERQKAETNEKFANRCTEYEQAKVRLRGKAELIFAKVRDGAPCTVPLLFHAETTSFSEPEQDQMEADYG